MSIVEKINNIREEQEKAITKKDYSKIPSNISSIFELCEQTPKDELKSITSFNDFIYFRKKDFMRNNYICAKVHVTTLFMRKPEIFDFLLKNNPSYVEAVTQQFHLSGLSYTYEHPINFKEIEKNKHKLMISLAEQKTPFNYSLYADVDSISSINKLWKKTGINHIHSLLIGENSEYIGANPSKVDLSYMGDKLFGERKLKASEQYTSFIEFEISRTNSLNYDQDRKIKELTPNFDLFLKLSGDNRVLFEHERNGIVQSISIKNLKDIFHDKLAEYPEEYQGYSALKKKNKLAKSMNKILKEQETLNSIVIMPEDGFNFKL